jgi:hypothetical protein
VRYALNCIEAAWKWLHHDVRAIARHKLAGVAWAVVNKDRNFEVTRVTRATATSFRPRECGIVRGAVIAHW